MGTGRSRFRHPSQILVVAFAAAVGTGTVLLLLPVSTRSGLHTGVVTALFTATSAVCVTGLATVDTGRHWTVFGQVVILALIQVGGFGIMTAASLLGLLVSRQMGLRSRLTVAAETKSLGLGDVRAVLLGVLRVSALFEIACAVVLTLRLRLGYGEPLGLATWHGVFHAVSAFNNAGFSLYPDNLVRFVTDPWVCVPVALAVIVGGLGFPVLFELRRQARRPRSWSLHTKLTLTMTAVLLVAGAGWLTINEWNNPGTLGHLDPGGRVLAGTFQAVMPRTAGFNSVEVGLLKQSTWLGLIVLMFIGGGPAGTAGGIKVTTFVVLLFALLAEVRGQSTVNAFDRRISSRVQRQALTVALLSIAAVVCSSLALMEITRYPLSEVLFEVTSAFATAGLSTGITPLLSPPGQLLLVFLMFLGRLGPITLVSALAVRDRDRLYQLPEGRPIIG
ncbi:MAG: TrkH family potassium uptake protein [Propionibacteriaceae bacterium]